MKFNYFAADGYTPVTAFDIGDIIANQSGAKKFFMQLPSGSAGAVKMLVSQVQGSDGYLYLKSALCPNSLSCPFNVAAAIGVGGSLTPGTTYYYRITAFNENGETTGSLEVSQTTTTNNKSITLSWDVLAGADGYLIYRSTTQGVYTNARRHVVQDPSIHQWTDTGQAADPSGPYSFPGINSDFDLPTENTTAGAEPTYGNAPTLAAGDLIITASGFIVGQMIAFWVGFNPPLSLSQSGNPYTAMLTFAEDE